MQGVGIRELMGRGWVRDIFVYISGVGIVKLMGREAGFVAMMATLASNDVDICLIPEAPFCLHKLCACIGT
jgi:6-phosphofructokinase